METIAIVAEKGGVGKTTIANNLAWHFADNKKKRVLAIDLDPQSNMASTLDSFENQGDANELFTGAVAARDMMPRLACFATATQLEDFVGERAADYIQQFRQNFARFAPHFDYCIIDTPGEWSMRPLSALIVCDHMLLPTEPKKYAVEGLQSFANTIATANNYRDVAINFLGIVLSKVQRTKEQQLHTETMRARIGDGLFESEIPESKAIEMANEEGVALWHKKGLRIYERKFLDQLNRFFAEVEERMETNDG